MGRKSRKTNPPQIRRRTKPTTGYVARTPKPPRTKVIDIEVELHRYEFNDDERALVGRDASEVNADWHASWSETGSQVGIEDSGPDLPVLIENLLDSLPAEYGEDAEFQLTWTLDGDRPKGGQTLEDAVKAAGVTLPANFQPKSS